MAIDLASRTENRDKLSAVLVENTFTSIPDIARSLFNFRLIRGLPFWCYKNKFKSKFKVCRISSVPVLFLAGCADNLIPTRMMDELYDSCGSEIKRLAKFPEGTHNETWMCSQYFPTISYFLDEVSEMPVCFTNQA